MGKEEFIMFSSSNENTVGFSAIGQEELEKVNGGCGGCDLIDWIAEKGKWVLRKIKH